MFVFVFESASFFFVVEASGGVSVIGQLPSMEFSVWLLQFLLQLQL